MAKNRENSEAHVIMWAAIITAVATVVAAFIQRQPSTEPLQATQPPIAEVKPKVSTPQNTASPMPTAEVLVVTEVAPAQPTLPSPTAFTVDDANSISMVNVNGKCDYSVPNGVLAYDDTGTNKYGLANSDGTVTWDLTQFPEGVVVGDAVVANVDGHDLSRKSDEPGVTFILTSPNPNERRYLRLGAGAFRVVPKQSGEGMLRLIQRNLECRGTYQSIVRYPLSASSTPTATTVAAPVEIASVYSETIHVYGNDGDGFLWRVNRTGTYQIRYESGAFSGWPESEQAQCRAVGCWKTTVRAYVNREVEWANVSGVVGPENADLQFDTQSTSATVEEAESLARQLNPKQIQLREGDYVIFIAVDAKLSYGKNPGQISLSVTLMTP